METTGVIKEPHGDIEVIYKAESDVVVISQTDNGIYNCAENICIEKSNIKKLITILKKIKL